MPITPRLSPTRPLPLGLSVMVAAAAGGLLLLTRPTSTPTLPRAAALLPSSGPKTAPSALDAPAPAKPWLAGCLGPAALGQVSGADIAALPPHELVVLPTRAEPIERWRAQRYFCPADFNRDDAIDDADTTAFLAAFADRTGPFAEFLDVNRDGTIDAADLEAFVHATETPCDPAKTAESRLVSC